MKVTHSIWTFSKNIEVKIKMMNFIEVETESKCLKLEEEQLKLTKLYLKAKTDQYLAMS